MSSEKSPLRGSCDNAIDLSHHLSILAKSRKLSPLKGLQKYIEHPGMINLAVGRPDPMYFPFDTISGNTLVPESFPKTIPAESSVFRWFWSIFGSGSETLTERITIPKYAAHEGDVDLATALQYSPATGMQFLQDFIREFVDKIYRPAYANWTTLIHAGNTDGINRAIDTLCNPCERILVAEWTYPSTLSTVQPLNVLPAPVKVDGQGMSSVDLERVLSEWDEDARGAKRPHVLYTVPIGQNPTGATMGAERKKAIYEICVKYDIIILEDDPYYFLQEGTYSPKTERVKSEASRRYAKGEDETRWIDSLTPSYVRYDYQGRVIRMDTFSKIIAPGSRLGWFTCNPLFAERLERQGETSTQAPSGFSQSLIAQLVAKQWGFTKFVRWLQGLQTQYIIRRDFFVDCVFDEFDVRRSDDAAAFGAGLPVLTAYTKRGTQEIPEKGEAAASTVPLFSFVPPSAGMFVWLKFHLSDDATEGSAEPGSDGMTMEQKVWTDAAEHGLLIGPGSMFAALPDGEDSPAGDGEMHFRISFSMGKFKDMRAGVKILAQVLRKYVKQ